MPDIWQAWTILAKLLLYIGSFGSAGLLLNRVLFIETLRPLQRAISIRTAALAVLALVGAISGFVLRGAALTGGSDGLTDPEMLGLLWQTPVGEALVYRLWGLGLILVGLCVSGIGQWVSLFGALLALWSFSRIGHVPDLDQVLGQLLLLIHLVGIAFWIGVLFPLYHLAMRPEQHETAAMLGHRFGQLALAVVPVLLSAGAVLAWLLLGGLEPLVTSAYGRILLVKLALVGMILALAAVNKLRFVPQLRAGHSAAGRALARAVGAEALLILLVFLVSAVLTSSVALPH